MEETHAPSIYGHGAIVIPGAQTHSFKTVGTAKSQQNTNTHTNINTVTQVTPAQLSMQLLVADTLANRNYTLGGAACTGSASVSNQDAAQTDSPTLSTTSLNIPALASGMFIHAGTGTDAISVACVGGTNILTNATSLTLHATQPGAPHVSFTLASYTTADLATTASPRPTARSRTARRLCISWR